MLTALTLLFLASVGAIVSVFLVCRLIIKLATWIVDKYFGREVIE